MVGLTCSQLSCPNSTLASRKGVVVVVDRVGGRLRRSWDRLETWHRSVPPTFRLWLGSDFRVSAGQSGSLGFRLTEVIKLSERPGQRRPFILRFEGPTSPVLA